MPPNGATQQGVGMTEEEIWQVVTYIRSVEKKPEVAGGDAKHGRELFYGNTDAERAICSRAKAGGWARI